MFKLKSLDLGGNPNLQLTSASFDVNLKALSDLNLSDCNISSMNSSLLRNLRNLHNLYLNNNDLSSLPRCFLENTPFVNTLQLSNNRLQSMDGVLSSNEERQSNMKLAVDGNDLTSLVLATKRLDIILSDMSRNRIGGIRVCTSYIGRCVFQRVVT